MVLPGLFSKPSKKKSESNISKENRRPISSSPTKRSPSRSPTKSTKESEQLRNRKKAGRSAHLPQYPADTHPLNLPPDERERRRSALSGVSDPLPSPMDIDREGSSLPSSPIPDAVGENQNSNGGGLEGHIESDTSPVPPPHRVIPATSPPPKPAIDPEICKAVGNKFFKAGDYRKAIQEYSKGEKALSLSHPSIGVLWSRVIAADRYKPLVSSLARSPISPTVLLLLCQRTNLKRLWRIRRWRKKLSPQMSKSYTA